MTKAPLANAELAVMHLFWQNDRLTARNVHDQLNALSDIPAELGHTNYNRFLLLDMRGRGSISSAGILGHLAEVVCATPMADDLLVLESHDGHDARLRIVGGDRREAKYCGNGALFAASLLGARKAAGVVCMATPIGPRRARREGTSWTVEVGEVHRMPVNEEPLSELCEGRARFLGLFQAGEPHLLLEVTRQGSEELRERTVFESFCEPFRDALGIEGGVNITVVFGHSQSRICVRTFERGVRRQTQSCGTGAVAAAALLCEGREGEMSVKVHAPGGTHSVRREGRQWLLTAPPRGVGSGRLLDLVDLIDIERRWTQDMAFCSSSGTGR